MIKLDRPLAVIDIESTGINPRQDRIIDLAIIKVHPDGKRETFTFRFHPEMAIPPESTAIHHITDADVANCPSFREKAPEVITVLNGCDLAGFGAARFDIPLLAEECARAGFDFNADAVRVLDAQRIFHKKEPRDLTAAVAFYCGDLHLGAHGAEADALAALNVLDAQFRKYPDLPQTMEELNTYCNPPRNPTWADRNGRLKWVNGELVINFGAQYIGQKLRDLAQNNTKFLKWILKSDFPSDTKRIVSDALEGRWPTPPAGPAGEDAAPAAVK
ncbi:MAG: 3'-5' exonuclease [Verrucomicrobia bacterium]|nr:3'-5' exonuclease [Verrucomicrobiota bacterium]MBU4247226.1 3'-5' exonuclease [Verrucomicrobiota bacterium]MBU4289968.1 3'-5' exonuclease [Verrucomicrobiota bacterium]MBU4498037.1 3'-5' exonuclease [Verrucomicrobiota bacterium]MCG2679684.1 3'-5' exonuclease [Kiritimatiellia bacterium]